MKFVVLDENTSKKNNQGQQVIAKSERPICWIQPDRVRADKSRHF